MLNSVAIQGRLTKDPELRHTSNGTAVATISLAVARDINKEETDFIDVVAWKQLGEFAARCLTKGLLVIVRGRLQMRDWQDKDGNKRRTAEIIAENIYFCESKKPNNTPVNVEVEDELPW